MTVTDWVVAVVATLALFLSIYNTYVQRRDRLPRLRVSTDVRAPEDLGNMIYSVRVVNEGSVPAQVRSVRLFLDKRRRRPRWGVPPWRVDEGRSIPFPSAEESAFPTDEEAGYVERSIIHNLWKNEKDTGKDLPYMLQQGESVRFATERYTVETRLLSVGLYGEETRFRVGAVDALDRAHTVDATMHVDAPTPEP